METNKLRFLLNLQTFAEENEPEENGENEPEKGNENENLSDKDIEDSEQKKVEEEKKKQSQRENARQAELRREREQKEKEEKIRKEAYLQGKLASQKLNEFTNKPIKDEEDLYVYEIQKRIKDRGGDPLEDLAEEMAKDRREKKAEESKKLEAQKQIDKDVQEFSKKYPDKTNILNDKTFAKFSNKRLGNEPLTAIYEDYLEFLDETKQQVEQELINKKKAEDEEKKRKNNNLSSNGNQGNSNKKYSEMTSSERQNYLKKLGYI